MIFHFSELILHSFRTQLQMIYIRKYIFNYNLVTPLLYNYNKPRARQITIELPRPPTAKQKSMAVYESQQDLQLAQEVTTLPLKEFSVQVHHLEKRKQKSPVFWSQVQASFLERLQPTTNPVVIRSYAKILYSLSKSKQATGNYETKISLLLPFATPQSFTTMATALSRIAPLSTEFSYILQKLYIKRKSQFNPRQLVSINYTLANNGRPCDIALIDKLEYLNAVQTITMLRCYDLSNSITPKILSKALKKLKAIKNEFNVLDISDFINLYLKHKFRGQGMEELMQQSYNILKRNVDDVCLEKIWQFMPESLNEGRVRIKFAEEVIETIKILRKSRHMGEVIWKRVKTTFEKVDNIEIKVKLEKIY